jgi:hypothetical protein
MRFCGVEQEDFFGERVVLKVIPFFGMYMHKENSAFFFYRDLKKMALVV